MSYILQGHFVSVKKLNIDVIQTNIPFCLLFVIPCLGFFISFMVGVRKVPQFNHYTGTISYIQYVHSVFFLDMSRNKPELIQSGLGNLYNFFPQELMSDLEMTLLLQAKDEKQFNEKIFKFKVVGDPEGEKSNILYEAFKFTKQRNLKTFRPNAFMYSYKEKQMHFDSKRNLWSLVPLAEGGNVDSEKYNKFKNYKFAEYFKTNAQFKQAVQLVEFLEKIPNFTIKLTVQEKKVIGQEGNVLVLGRSGTGKTTCLMLRLFAMEFLFKLRMKQVRKKFENLFGVIKDDKFGSQDVDNLTGMHSIFVTASPVLCQEVRNYYDKLKNHVKIELMKKEEGEIKKKEQITMRKLLKI